MLMVMVALMVNARMVRINNMSLDYGDNFGVISLKGYSFQYSFQFKQCIIYIQIYNLNYLSSKLKSNWPSNLPPFITEYLDYPIEFFTTSIN